MRIAIIGGGTAGLAAAYELEQARRKGAPVEYVVFELSERLGGTLWTETVAGAVLERGPDSFITEKPAATELARELGLGAELVPSNDAARKTHIVVGNRLRTLPDGLMFLVPTKLVPTALSPLFSLSTKIRMGLELLSPPRPKGEDESVADLVRRHFGQETVDRLADPLLSGIYGGDATELSARTVLPRLVQMEAEYGSLSRGMLAAHRKMVAAKKASAASQANTKDEKNPRGIFTTVRGGMQRLADGMAASLNPAWLRSATPVSALEQTASGWRLVAAGRQESFDAVVMAAPAWAASVLLRAVDAALAQEMEGIPYSSSVTVNLLYDERKLGRLPEGFGFLVPAVEGRAMLAATFSHRKFLGRTPEGKAVVRAFLGGMRNEAMLAERDEVLVATVRRELAQILGSAAIPAGAEPEYAQVTRWRRAMAQYAVGHLERKQRIAARAGALPGLKLAGNAYDGIGVPDCIRLGRQAAKELLASSH
jgi:oxygen-dependent protoporphyrinogen oxidase